MKNTIKLYNGKAYGVKVSGYGLDHGYLDYAALAEIVGDCILNNTIMQEFPYGWEPINGCEFEEDECYEIYQWYIISEHGYNVLSELTDEIVYYNNDLDLHLWGITHFGTSWDYVLTNVKIVEQCKEAELDD